MCEHQHTEHHCNTSTPSIVITLSIISTLTIKDNRLCLSTKAAAQERKVIPQATFEPILMTFVYINVKILAGVAAHIFICAPAILLQQMLKGRKFGRFQKFRSQLGPKT